MSRYFNYIFHDKESYNNESFYGPAISSFLIDYVVSKFEK